MLKDIVNLSLPELEEKVLKYWKEKQIFEKSLEFRKGSKKKFVFYEGPPTANGMPGIHHTEARAFKDVMPRYKTMRGYYVPRKAGWDTHGLPVELQTEKELGMKHKGEIEKFGIAEFNEKCKDLVWRYRSEFEASTTRMGFWLDLKNPYITYENSYMESIWWILSQVDKQGLLKKMLRTVPWCTRCQTPLSSHELGQPGAYKPVKDPSLYVKFLLKEGKTSKIKTYFLAWTTTPWTLPANLALAVHPKLTYTKFLVKNTLTGVSEYIWSFNTPPAIEGVEASVVEKVSGRKLVGSKYEPLYPAVRKHMRVKSNKLFTVHAGDFVSTEDGSGIVHIAPSFGEDDFKLMNIREGLPLTIDDEGKMVTGFPGAGMYIKKADGEVLKDLGERGLLYMSGVGEHEYPHCWRCSSPLIYMVRESWFIEMSKLRSKLIAENKKINWIPEHIKEGRFGEWLNEIKDWSISRNRYWGTPLPVWECQKCEKHLVISSLADLDTHASTKNDFFFIRHAEATSNEGSWVASLPERGKKISVLTKKGIEQAQAMAAALKKEKIDIIFASPLKRTQQTARIIAKATGAKVITDKRLREIEVGAFNGSMVAEYNSYFAGKLDRFFTKPPGKAETLTEVRARAVDFATEVNKKFNKKKIAIVSHGDVLWMLDSAMRGHSNEETIASDYYPEHGKVHAAKVHNWPFDKGGSLNMHRPFIDSISVQCTSCKKPMTRVTDILDVWLDSGAMPYASMHFPFAYVKDKEKEISTKALNEAYEKLDFPADYIAEGVDQTRGWFYTLLALGTLLKKGSPYKNAISVGLVLDKNGVKMSKSKGNIVSPTEMMNKYGADSVRWYFYTINDPGDPKRFDERDLGKIVRKLMLILYNSFVFWNSYGKRHETQKETYEPEHVLDQWILARMHALVQTTTKKLDAYRIGEASRLIELFIDDLSRWYIRRSRDRFQSAARGSAVDERDWSMASYTLQTVLLTIAKLMAPMTPFFSEALYQSLGGSSESVHLDSWPVADTRLVNAALVEAMAKIRTIAADALALRAEAKIKVRQPLTTLTIKDDSLESFPQLLEILKDEVNVKKVVFDSALKSEKGIALDLTITQELREEGIIREVARTVQGLRQDAKYAMADEITLFIDAPDEATNLIQRYAVSLKRAVNAKQIELKRTDKADATLETKIGEWPTWIGVKK